MASNYTMVAYGSQGSTVKKLQNELNKRGYQLDEDGIFGKKTQSAVRDYQKKYGLTMIDGIAGDETWGSLLGGNTAWQETAQPTYGGTSPVSGGYTAVTEPVSRAEVTAGTSKRLAELEQGYTPSEDVLAAMAYRDSVAAMEPEGYTSRFEAALSALYDQIAGREAFSYDPEEDQLYQNYAKLYARQGAAAMEDTLGQAAALTGGYGSSYAQTAGQQSYNRHLNELATLVPELYQSALNAYRQEGQSLADQYALLAQREKSDYGRWQDAVAQWQESLGAAQDDYEAAGDRDRKNYQSLLDYFADKAQQERKLSAAGAVVSDSGSGSSRQESLSSTAAESLRRAMTNYLKSGKADKAQSLLRQYTARLTPAQQQQFTALFRQYGQAAI